MPLTTRQLNYVEVLAATVAWILLCRPVAAQEYSQEFISADGLAALSLEQRGKRVDVGYRTIFPTDEVVATVTFEAGDDLENLVPDVDLPLTVTVRGRSPVKVFSLTIQDPAKAWGAPIVFWLTYGARGATWLAGPAPLPYAADTGYRILQGHNGRVTHKGEHRHALDWGMPEGTPVLAIREGVVVALQEGYTLGGMSNEYWGKDNYVSVLHGDGTVARYVHMVAGGVVVEIGRKVRAGEPIAWSGNTGYSDGPHLHLDVISPVDGKTRDTIAVPFITGCAPDGEVPVEGVVYSASRCGVLDVEHITVVTGVHDDVPTGAGTVFAGGMDLALYIPIDRPGAHRLRVRFVSKTGTEAAGGEWSTEPGWWYTYWTFRVAPGVWSAEVFRDGQLERTVGFRVE